MAKKRWWSFGAEQADESEVGSTYADLNYTSSVAADALPPRLHQTALPTFLASAKDRVHQGSPDRTLRARLTLRDYFTPTQPVTGRRHFAGRTEVLQQLIQMVEDQRSHVVLYGERGMGKTSLLHVFADVAREAEYLVTYTTCGAASRFEDIFRALLRQIPMLYLKSISPTANEAETGSTLDQLLSEGEFSARRLAEIYAEITGTRLIVILDEFDRVEEPSFRHDMADLIKGLSDRAARVTIILSGVGANLQELIGYVPSIRRNVLGLAMPRMSEDELRSLLALGGEASKMTFEPEAAAMIATNANGSPYLARLLAHHASMTALDAGRMDIGTADVDAAIEQATSEARSRVSPAVFEALSNTLQGSGDRLLEALVTRATLNDGDFSEAEIRNATSGLIPPQEVHDRLRQWSATGGILKRHEHESEARFRFRDEALSAYIWFTMAKRRGLSPR